MPDRCCFCDQPVSPKDPGGMGTLNDRDRYHAGRGQCLRTLQAAGWRPPESPESALDAH